jgi:hypothetical protein
MSFESIFPSRPKRQPGELYTVWVPAVYEEDVKRTLQRLMTEAQSDETWFTPDDLVAELTEARRILANAPHDDPCRLIFDPSRHPRFQPTHVLPGEILHIWYLVWDDNEFVGVCRFEPNEARDNLA